MSNPVAQARDSVSGSDRRLYSRQAIRTLAYVELDEGNGGIVLNISEGGLSVQAFASVMEDVLPSVRFQLSESDDWIHANARITWTGESRKLAGLEFVDLAEDSRSRIKEWLIREALPPAPPSESLASSKVGEPQASLAARVTREPTVSPASAPQPVSLPENHAVAEAPAAEFQVPVQSAPTPEILAPAAEEVFAPTKVEMHEVEAAPSAPAVEVKPFVAEKLVANRVAAVAVLLILAVVSLVAGWSAGQGVLGKFVRRFRTVAPQNGANDRDVASNSTIQAARISEIEVMNASGQRWMIPFNGPMDNPTDAAHRQPYANPASQARKAPTGFRTWILSPPQQTRAAADDGALAKVSPPVLAEAPASGADGVLTSSGSINSHGLAAPPALRVPDPPVPTGVVKQGQLLRRVDPDYPAIAREQHAEGTVRLNVTVGPDGIVRGISVLGGPRLLVEAAEFAVRQWRYTPTTLDGKPVEFQREVDLTFHLSNPAR